MVQSISVQELSFDLIRRINQNQILDVVLMSFDSFIQCFELEKRQLLKRPL